MKQKEAGSMTLVDYMQWISAHLVDTQEKFTEAMKDPNSVIVLKAFFLPNDGSALTQALNAIDTIPPLGFDPDSVPADNLQHFTLAVVFSSPAMLSNIKRAVEGKRFALNITTDATYKITDSGWALCDCGTTSLNFKNGNWVQQFVPFAYLLSRSESTYAYVMLFEAARDLKLQRCSSSE